MGGGKSFVVADTLIGDDATLAFASFLLEGEGSDIQKSLLQHHYVWWIITSNTC